MPTEILMPALSPTMEEGKLAKWLVEEGQTIKAGDIIAEIETDKATMEVEASDEGKVSKLLIPAGTEGVKVNTPIAVLDGDGAAREVHQGPLSRRPSCSCAGCRSVTASFSSAGVSDARCPRRRARDRARHRDGQRRPCARRCATPWPRRCGATQTSS